MEWSVEERLFETRKILTLNQHKVKTAEKKSKSKERIMEH